MATSSIPLERVQILLLGQIGRAQGLQQLPLRAVFLAITRAFQLAPTCFSAQRPAERQLSAFVSCSEPIIAGGTTGVCTSTNRRRLSSDGIFSGPYVRYYPACE